MNKVIKYFLVLMFLLRVYYGQTSIGLNSGTSIDNNHRIGFNVGGELFKEVSDNIFLGGRVAFNRWYINRLDDIQNEYNSVTIIELLPSIRIVSSIRNQKTQFFGQVGTGYYTFKDYRLYNTSEKFGLNFGGGIIISNLLPKSMGKLSIYPLYNIVFTDEKTMKYLTFNIGFLFN